MVELSPAQANQMLREQLRRYRLDEALALVGHLSVAIVSKEFREKLAPEVLDKLLLTVLPHQPPYMAKALIQLSNDYRARTMGPGDYRRCAELYNTAQGLELGEGDTPEEIERMLLRIQHQQFPAQRRQLSDLPRTLALYQDLGSRPEFTHTFNIPARFEELTGLTVEQFIECGVRVWASVLRSGDAELEAWNGPGAGEAALLAGRMDRFVACVSAGYADFRAACARFAPSDPDFEFYAFNPLETYPIIRTDRSGLVLPSPQLLLSRVTLGIYYHLQSEYRADFTNTFGLVFQEYVGELLRWVYDRGEVQPESRYGRKKAQRDSIDWIVVEGDRAVLIECKVSRLSLESKVSADPVRLTDDLKKLLVRAVKQLHRFMDDIRNGAPGLEQLTELSTLVPVVVVLDPFYGANTPPVRNLVEKELIKEGIRPFEYQVISVDELEPALPFLRERGFARTLLEKIADGTTPNDPAVHWGFGTYMRQVAPDTKNVRHPLLAKYWNAFRESLNTDAVPSER